MAQTTIDKATARFEKIWQEAQSQTAVKSRSTVVVDSNPLDYLESLMPQTYASHFADLADQCLAEKLLSEEQHAQLKQASSIQETIFSGMNQEKLKKVILSIDR